MSRYAPRSSSTPPDAPGDGDGGLATHPAARTTVVLVGMMGAGKSTVGRRLAERFGVPFVDADMEIERAAGCSISEIFAVYGEAGFRDGERRVLARLLDGPPHVLATGGGAFNDPETRARIAKVGVSVWLRVDLDTLVKRVSRRGHRPLLAGGRPRETLRRLLAEREPVYALADLVVDADDRPLEQTVDMVVSALNRYLRERRDRDGDET